MAYTKHEKRLERIRIELDSVSESGNALILIFVVGVALTEQSPRLLHKQTCQKAESTKDALNQALTELEGDICTARSKARMACVRSPSFMSRMPSSIGLAHNSNGLFSAKLYLRLESVVDSFACC